MGEMQERVTDAIMGAFEHIPDKEYRRTIAGCWARAAIETMRKPTEEMKAAVADEKESNNYYSASVLIECGYEKMIDAALAVTNGDCQ